MPLVKFEETSLESTWTQLGISLGGIINGTRAVWDSYEKPKWRAYYRHSQRFEFPWVH